MPQLMRSTCDHGRLSWKSFVHVRLPKTDCRADHPQNVTRATGNRDLSCLVLSYHVDHTRRGRRAILTSRSKSRPRSDRAGPKKYTADKTSYRRNSVRFPWAWLVAFDSP